MENDKLSTKWISPEITCSFPNLAEPAEEKYGGKYALSIPLPKKDTQAYAKLVEAMVNAAVNEWGEKARDLKGIKHFVEDCDNNKNGEEPDETYKGCYKFSAKAKRQPGMVYPNLQPVAKEEIENVFYPGAVVRVSISAYGTETGGARTVAFGLNNVMFVRDGKRIGGASKPDEDFGDFADQSFSRDPFDDSPTQLDLF
jgi:hypothetical protein